MKIRFVLVRCSYPSNMGATARALKVMGFDDLWFVNPGRPILHERALATATHGAEILESALTVNSLEHALNGVDVTVGTTIKARSNVALKVSVRDLRSHLDAKLPEDATVAVVFGGESTGMTNAELDQCDLVASIPTIADHPSLNLAQAVMIFAYELSQATKVHGKTKLTGPPLVAGEYQHFVSDVKDWLNRIGIADDHRAHREVLSRLPLLAASDIRLLRFLRNKSEGLDPASPR